MANWLQRLEARWARRYVPHFPEPPPEDAGRRPVCLITGGSEGLGCALAGEFAREGHRLLLVARNADALDAVAAQLRGDFGVEVMTLAADLSGADYLDRIEQVLNRNSLYVDILVNNAAFGLSGLLAQQEPARLTALCRVNVEALTVLTRHFLPAMLQRARGGVLNVSSIGGLIPGPYMAAYYASKAYVNALTEALAFENAGQGVRISAAAPGPLATRFHERMGTQHAFYLQLQQVMSAASAAHIIYRGFMGRRTIIVPGLIASLNAFFVRYIPHVVMVPFIGWFLKRRY